MSECVVRMEMPQNCYECEMRGAWAFCPIGKWPVVGYKKQRHEDCPILCQLPEGHGELIDRQVVYEKIKWWQENTHDTVTKAMLHEFYLMLFGVPAIVPAEAERSET